MSVSKVLARAGYAVTLAASGAEALQRVSAERYEAVICDLRMPGLSGIALFDQLQQIAPALAGRILVASGDLSQPETTVFLERTGAPGAAQALRHPRPARGARAHVHRNRRRDGRRTHPPAGRATRRLVAPSLLRRPLLTSIRFRPVPFSGDSWPHADSRA